MVAIWVAKGPAFPQAGNTASEHTMPMRTLISIFAVLIYHLVPYAGYQLN